MADNSNYIENLNDILITNYSHGQVKPRLTEKRETLKGESWLPYHMEEKREKGGGWYALKLLARIWVKFQNYMNEVSWKRRNFKMCKKEFNDTETEPIKVR